MSDLAVHIMLHGLIALVPMNDGVGANEMMALLVDARQRPAGIEMECFSPHIPTLVVKTNTTAECVAAGCEAGNNSRCTCQLDRHEIGMSIVPTLQLPRKHLSERPPTALPFNHAAAADFGYVVNMSQPPLNAKLDLSFRDSAEPGKILAARMRFPIGSVTSCDLGSLPDEGASNIHAMSFRPLNASEKPGDLHQALAQQVMVHFDVPSDPNQKVSLKLQKFGDPDSLRELTLKPVPNPGGKPFVEIHLMNERASLRDDDPCEDGVGRDFAFFYELTENPEPWALRSIPHIKYTRWKSARDLAAPGCEMIKDPGSRPICPMGSFNFGEAEGGGQ